MPINRNRAHVDECQDRVCSDTKTKLNLWMKTSEANHNDCPLDINSLGRNTWSLLHTIAASYPQKPSPDERKNMQEFIKLMSILYPCGHCAKEFREDIIESPPRVDSRASLSLWFCDIHNKVNRKLGKTEFDCKKVDERWRTGWKDGSCL